MPPVYFDTSVFISIFTGDSSSAAVKELLRELNRDKTRIYTSIITVQEVSVQPYRKGTPVEDRFEKVDKLARIEGVTKEIALTAAKYEAHIKDQTQTADQEDNKRRKWDCFHLATAVVLKCRVFYTLDNGQLKRKSQFALSGLEFLKPQPVEPTLFPEAADKPATN